MPLGIGQRIGTIDLEPMLGLGLTQSAAINPEQVIWGGARHRRG